MASLVQFLNLLKIFQVFLLMINITFIFHQNLKDIFCLTNFLELIFIQIDNYFYRFCIKMILVNLYVNNYNLWDYDLIIKKLGISFEINLIFLIDQNYLSPFQNLLFKLILFCDNFQLFSLKFRQFIAYYFHYMYCFQYSDFVFIIFQMEFIKI